MGWVMPSKNLREISLRQASVQRFTTNNIDIYGMPRVEFKIIWSGVSVVSMPFSD